MQYRFNITILKILFPIKEIIDIYILFKEYEEFCNELYNFAVEMEKIISVKELIE